MAAKIITFEGIDGSGKTTLVDAVGKHFAHKGLHVWSTREPFLLDTIHPDPFTATMQLMADRRAHCAAMQGDPAFDLILIDRFDLSTEAYQGWGNGVSISLIQRLNDIATESIDVSLRIWLDLPVEVAVERIEKRGESLTPAEIERLGRVHSGYGWMWSAGRLRRIDATEPPDNVLADAIKLIDEVLTQ